MSGALTDFVRDCGVKEPEAFLAVCDEFYTLLCDANRQFNLTRLSDRWEYDVKHIWDSLAVLRYAPECLPEGARVADVGCGAGFPSVVLAAARRDLRVTAIDSIHKKTDFVAMARERLGLDNLIVINGRANELARKPELRGKFDVVTARAVASAGKIRKEATGLLKKTGRFVLYQTPAQSEREAADFSGDALYRWRQSETFELPEGMGSRVFMIGERKP